MKKWILIVIGILIVGFAGYWFFAAKSNNQQVMAQSRTAIVQKGKLDVKVSGSGTVQPVTSEDIKSTINNNSIEEVLVSTGEDVKKGTDLITFTDGSDPITAPADGTITKIAVTTGQRVNIGEVVAHLTNYSNLKTVVQIDELDIPKVKIGQTVNIKVSAYPDQTFTGKVEDIANEGTSTNGVTDFPVTISLDSSKNLKVDMSTEASILTASKANALYVPVDAVHTVNNQKFVILGSNNSAQNSGRQVVKTGLENEDYVEITQGLTEGQTVQLPKLAVNTTGTSQANYSRGMMGGGLSQNGGMNRINRNGGGVGNKNAGGSGN